MSKRGVLMIIRHLHDRMERRVFRFMTFFFETFSVLDVSGDKNFSQSLSYIFKKMLHNAVISA